MGWSYFKDKYLYTVVASSWLYALAHCLEFETLPIELSRVDTLQAGEGVSGL